MHRGAKSIKKRWLRKSPSNEPIGAEVYSQTIVKRSPVGYAVKKLQEKDKASLRVNAAYYLAKHKRSFTNYM